MSLRLGTIQSRAPILRGTEGPAARLWLVGQGGSMYKFERPVRGSRPPAWMLFAICAVTLVFAVVVVLATGAYVRAWLQGLLLLLSLVG